MIKNDTLASTRILHQPWHVFALRGLVLIIVNTAALLITLYFLGRRDLFTTFHREIISLVFLVGALKAIIRPILVRFTLPFTMMTLGLITF